MIGKRPVTNALATLLEQATGRPVGRGKMPTTVPRPHYYYVLYSLTTELSGPELADLNEDLSLVYQVTSVSGPDPDVVDSAGTVDQAEWLADKAREAVLGRDPNTGLWLHPLTVTGVSVMGRALDTEPGGTNDPADAIISYVQRFRLDLTPA